MLGLHQSDALCQRRPLSSDQPVIKFIQQSLLRPTQVLYVLAGCCAFSPCVLAAVRRDDAPVLRAWSSEAVPTVKAARLGECGGSGWGDVAEESEAKLSHCVSKVGRSGRAYRLTVNLSSGTSSWGAYKRHRYSSYNSHRQANVYSF